MSNTGLLSDIHKLMGDLAVADVGAPMRFKSLTILDLERIQAEMVSILGPTPALGFTETDLLLTQIQDLGNTFAPVGSVPRLYFTYAMQLFVRIVRQIEKFAPKTLRNSEKLSIEFKKVWVSECEHQDQFTADFIRRLVQAENGMSRRDLNDTMAYYTRFMEVVDMVRTNETKTTMHEMKEILGQYIPFDQNANHYELFEKLQQTLLQYEKENVDVADARSLCERLTLAAQGFEEKNFKNRAYGHLINTLELVLYVLTTRMRESIVHTNGNPVTFTREWEIECKDKDRVICWMIENDITWRDFYGTDLNIRVVNLYNTLMNTRIFFDKPEIMPKTVEIIKALNKKAWRRAQ